MLRHRGRRMAEDCGDGASVAATFGELLANGVAKTMERKARRHSPGVAEFLDQAEKPRLKSGLRIWLPLGINDDLQASAPCLSVIEDAT